VGRPVSLPTINSDGPNIGHHNVNRWISVIRHGTQWMNEIQTPYKPPDSTNPGRARSVANAMIVFVLLPMVGGAFGFFGYLCLAVYFESRIIPTKPSLSYGQSLPLCTLIGATIGFASAFAVVRFHTTAVSLLLLTGLVGFGITNSMLKSQRAEYGYDPSEAVLFYPLFICSGVAIALAAMIAGGSVIRWAANRS